MSEWNWLPIEQAPKDRAVLIWGGVWWCERGGGDPVDRATIAQFDDGIIFGFQSCQPWAGHWIICDCASDAPAWVEDPTHFCELPTPPKIPSADLAQKENGPEEESDKC